MGVRARVVLAMAGRIGLFVSVVGFQMKVLANASGVRASTSARA